MSSAVLCSVLSISGGVGVRGGDSSEAESESESEEEEDDDDEDEEEDDEKEERTALAAESSMSLSSKQWRQQSVWLSSTDESSESDAVSECCSVSDG